MHEFLLILYSFELFEEQSNLSLGSTCSKLYLWWWYNLPSCLKSSLEIFSCTLVMLNVLQKWASMSSLTKFQIEQTQIFRDWNQSRTKIGDRKQNRENLDKRRRHKLRFDKANDDDYKNWRILDKITKCKENPSKNNLTIIFSKSI